VTRAEIQVRDELNWIRTRYDHGATSLAMASTLKRLEQDIAWGEHALGNWRSLGDAAMKVVNKLKQKQVKHDQHGKGN
jgi:hypothetical protein